jgi:hypothetical protein
MPSAAMASCRASAGGWSRRSEPDAVSWKIISAPTASKQSASGENRVSHTVAALVPDHKLFGAGSV